MVPTLQLDVWQGVKCGRSGPMSSSTNMKLNDFLRSNLGGEEWVVERNGNVTMRNFMLRPTMFINDNEILGIITALPSYRELEKRKILLEAIYKLHHEGVLSLEQWRDYEGKDKVSPLARGKPHADFF
ncbi:retrotransposon hot spot protein (RHS) [Trypanosoma cruzi]|nr:retrotransposon hot spot protein (RHS) [Trypanosoma cruzi]